MVAGIVEGEQWFKRHPELCTAIGSICLTSCYCSLHSIGAIRYRNVVRYSDIIRYSDVIR